MYMYLVSGCDKWISYPINFERVEREFHVHMDRCICKISLLTPRAPLQTIESVITRATVAVGLVWTCVYIACSKL